MKAKLATLALVVLVASATLGAMAYTTGSVSRSASADVVTDDVGLISLQPGQDGLVTQESDRLAIDFTNGGAAGVNTNATFTIGDEANANTSYAFNVTNLDTESHDFTFTYNEVAEDNNDADNFKYYVYDDSGTSLAMASEETPATTSRTITTGETIYVVVVVDTNGLGSADDLSGTLEISA